MKKDQPIAKKTAQASLSDIGKSLSKLTRDLARYTGFIYVVILLVGITTAVYVVSQSLGAQLSPESTDISGNQDFSLTFDQATVKRINSPSAESATTTGRVNPFSE